ncbi:MAG: alanine--glyoxylate aminotransferase family protein [Gemmatimonadetes bacterium]|nr:MAG: alanine--glyoxylate aminotransferase family protein [Gemmatimonadota bacterium]
MSEPTAERRGWFFLPGPTEVHPDVLCAQARQPISHRGSEIQALLARIQEGLREVFQTARPVLVSTSSATGLMEAGLLNGGRGRVLATVCGAFSARFAEIAQDLGRDVDVLEVPWGEAIDPGAVADRVSSGRYQVVTVVHNETSTGVINRVDRIAEAVRQRTPEALVLVDSVSGLSGAEMRPDAWGLDWVLTGSQKALALPPGLAFATWSERFAAAASETAGRGMYFDLARFEAQLDKHQTPTTPAVTLLYALDVQLQRIRAEGVEARWARHEAMARRTWAWVEELHDRGVYVEVLAPEGCRSPTVTCVRLPRERSGPEVVARMRERGWVIGGGYGRLKETTIRIGHMGEHDVSTLEPLLADLTEVLTE